MCHRIVFQQRIWSTFLKKIEIAAPDLYNVLEFILIIPNGTADVERFFKVLKEMKSKRRNNISAEKLRKLLKIFFFLENNPDKDMLFRLFVEEYKKIQERKDSSKEQIIKSKYLKHLGRPVEAKSSIKNTFSGHIMSLTGEAEIKKFRPTQNKHYFLGGTKLRRMH